MNMTIAELLEKLQAKNAFQTYEGDDTQYIAAEFLVFVDGCQVKGIISDDNEFGFELEDGSANDYGNDDVVTCYFYRLEEL